MFLSPYRTHFSWDFWYHNISSCLRMSIHSFCKSDSRIIKLWLSKFSRVRWIPFIRASTSRFFRKIFPKTFELKVFASSLTWSRLVTSSLYSRPCGLQEGNPYGKATLPESGRANLFCWEPILYSEEEVGSGRNGVSLRSPHKLKEKNYTKSYQLQLYLTFWILA